MATTQACAGVALGRLETSPNLLRKKQPKVNEVKESADAVEDSADLGQLTGSWMLLNGCQNTSNRGDI